MCQITIQVSKIYKKFSAAAEGFAEREQGEEGDLEMLDAERDADDGDAADEAENEMGRGNLPPPDKDPEDVHTDAQTTCRILSLDDFRAERPEGEDAEFPKLTAERDADDGDAEKQPGQEISERDKKSAQHEP